MFEVKLFKVSDESVVVTVPAHNPNEVYKQFIKFLFDPEVKRIVVSKK